MFYIVVTVWAIICFAILIAGMRWIDKFLFHPNMTGHGSYQELHYEAKVDIQP